MNGNFYENYTGQTMIEDDFQNHDLVIARGFNLHIVDQLIHNSRQPHIMDVAIEDFQGPFKDVSSFATWWKGHEANRQPLALYTLLGQNALRLEGALWHYPERLKLDTLTVDSSKIDQLADANHGFKIRIYEAWVGHQIAAPFMRVCLQDYMEQPQAAQNMQGVWLSTSAAPRNSRTVELFESFGYEACAMTADMTRLIMVLSAERAQEIKHAYAGVGD